MIGVGKEGVKRWHLDATFFSSLLLNQFFSSLLLNVSSPFDPVDHFLLEMYSSFGLHYILLFS